MEKFNPDKYPNHVFPNWFDREDIEEYAGRKLTDKEWKEIKAHIVETLMDEISSITYNAVNNFINENKQ